MHHIPKRSLGGCLTCRKRKKKCDETRPNCQRCIKGDFHCLGYGLLETSGNPNESSLDQSSVQRGTSAPHLDREFHLSDLSLSSIRSSNPQPIGTAPRNTSNFQTTPAFITIPQAPMLQLDLSTIHEILPLVVSQYAAASRHMFFKPLPFSIEDGLRWRVQISEVTRWSMYLVARILEDMSSGNNGQRYISWITHFYQKIIGSSASSELVKHLNPHLAGLHDLAGCVVMISGSSAGYSFFKAATPLFLQLAARSPELWSNDGAISISGALRSNLHEIKSFVLHDTITALAHGIPPLLCYDTSSPWAEDTQHPRLEWVYGIPAGIIMSLAKINSWRVSRVLDQVVSNGTERRIIEDCLLGWTPTVDQTSETVEDVARLAVLECWRHAALIFLYMGMYDVNSADPRVEAGVRQVTQLASTVTADNPLESHLLIPCLIAAAAARREKQRAVLRRKVGVFRLAPSLMLRGTDFLVVLDHLWHGVASGGRPTTWDDYVQSRYIALPIAT